MRQLSSDSHDGMAGTRIVPCEQSGAAGQEDEWPPCRRKLWSTRAAFWGYCVKEGNYKQRKKKDDGGITVDFRGKESKGKLGSRTAERTGEEKCGRGRVGVRKKCWT